MTLTSTTVRTSYTGNGATTTFAYPFRIMTATDLVVIQIDADTGVATTLSYPTNYSVSGVGNTSGGSITLGTAPATGDTLVILRSRPVKQESTVRNQGPYYAETHETAWDSLAMIAQDQQDQLDRSIRVPNTHNPASMSLELAPETGKALVWQSPTQLGNSTIDTSAIAVPGESRTVSTATAYLLNNRVFNLADFGTGLGVGADATAAWGRATTAITNAGGGILRVPAGTYGLDPVDLVSNMMLVFDPGALLYANTGYGANDRMLVGSGLSNVTIIGNGAVLRMRKSDYTTGEQRHGLFLLGCTDVYGENLTIEDTGGDGVYIGGTTDVLASNVTCDRVTLVNVHAVNTRRNGWSITDGRNILLVGCSARDVVGTDPQVGFDLEPNTVDNQIENVRLVNCWTENCAQGGLLFAPSLQATAATRTDASPKIPWSVEVVNFRSYQDGDQGGICFAYGQDSAFPVKGTIRIRGGNIHQPDGPGVKWKLWPDDGPQIVMEDVDVVDPYETSTSGLVEDKAGFSSVIDGTMTSGPANIELIRCRADDFRTVHRMSRPFHFSIGSTGQSYSVTIQDPAGTGWTVGPLMVERGVCKLGHTTRRPTVTLADGSATEDYLGYEITCPTSGGVLSLPSRRTTDAEIQFVHDGAHSYTVSIDATNAPSDIILDATGTASKTYHLRGIGDSVTFRHAGLNQWRITQRVKTDRVLTFTDGDTTPSVLGESVCNTANTGATSITTFDDGVNGQVITVLVDANTTLVHGATLKLAGGVNFVGTANDTISLTRVGGVWYERGRSVNG